MEVLGVGEGAEAPSQWGAASSTGGQTRGAGGIRVIGELVLVRLVGIAVVKLVLVGVGGGGVADDVDAVVQARARAMTGIAAGEVHVRQRQAPDVAVPLGAPIPFIGSNGGLSVIPVIVLRLRLRQRRFPLF